MHPFFQQVGALFVLPCSVSRMLIPLPSQLSTKKWKEYMAREPSVISSKYALYPHLGFSQVLTKLLKLLKSCLLLNIHIKGQFLIISFLFKEADLIDQEPT